MHAFEVDTNALNDLERNGFLSPTPRARIGIPSQEPGDAPAALAKLADEPMADWLERVVDKTYLAGMPAGVMASEGAAAAPHLLAMLDAEDHPARRRNIIRALGFTKHDAAIESLLDGVFSPQGRLTHDQFAAVAESFLALGRLSRSDATGTALQFLMDGADPEFWRRADLTWSYGPYQGPSLDALLARLAVMAMGVSADGAALDYLRSLRQPGDDSRWAAEWVDQIDEAIARLTETNETPLAFGAPAAPDAHWTADQLDFAKRLRAALA